MKNTRFLGPMLAAVMFVFCVNAPSTMAKTYRTQFVYVVMNCGSIAPGIISVISDDEDVPPFDVKPHEATNLWRGKSPIAFDAEGHVASLRVARGRTGCAKAIHEPAQKPDEEGDWVAQYRFTCDFAPAWKSLRIENDADLPISTVRSMSEFMPGDVPCKEESTMRKMPWDIEAVAWKQEDIYIQFDKPGKLFYEYYNMLIKNGKFAGEPIKDEMAVTRKAVLDQLKLRAGRGTGNAATIRDVLNLDKRIKVVRLKKVE
jgi:hypothetical protein